MLAVGSQTVPCGNLMLAHREDVKATREMREAARADFRLKAAQRISEELRVGRSKSSTLLKLHFPIPGTNNAVVESRLERQS